MVLLSSSLRISHPDCVHQKVFGDSSYPVGRGSPAQRSKPFSPPPRIIHCDTLVNKATHLRVAAYDHR